MLFLHIVDDGDIHSECWCWVLRSEAVAEQLQVLHLDADRGGAGMCAEAVFIGLAEFVRRVVIPPIQS